MRELALFAGAGGGILGGKLLGWRTVCAVEINAFCARRLMQRQNEGHIPPFPVWDDVCSFDGRPWRDAVDVVSGGFPCQDISVAGGGEGIDGKRSGLWREMARIIGEIRPRYAFMENSPALTIRGLEESLETWPKWGLMRDGACFPSETLVECICESASSFTLPTPRSCSAMAARITENTPLAKYPNLETVLARLTLPTLGANEYRGASAKRFTSSPHFRGAKMSEGLRTCETDPIYLNPSFAELVMMWPMGWSACEPLETGSVQEWLSSHGKPSAVEA